MYRVASLDNPGIDAVIGKLLVSLCNDLASMSQHEDWAKEISIYFHDRAADHRLPGTSRGDDEIRRMKSRAVHKSATALF